MAYFPLRNPLPFSLPPTPLPLSTSVTQTNFIRVGSLRGAGYYIFLQIYSFALKKPELRRLAMVNRSEPGAHRNQLRSELP